MTTTPVRAVIDPPVAIRRWAPPAGAVVVAVGLWWLTTTVLSAPHSLLRQAAPQRVAPAVVDLFSRGVLLPGPSPRGPAASRLSPLSSDGHCLFSPLLSFR